MEIREDILFYAFRYALGRMTYVVQDVTDCLIENWYRLSRTTKRLVIEEIQKAINEGKAGMSCDEERWRAVLLLEEAVKDAPPKNELDSPNRNIHKELNRPKGCGKTFSECHDDWLLVCGAPFKVKGETYIEYCPKCKQDARRGTK